MSDNRRELVGPAPLRKFYRRRFNPIVTIVVIIMVITILSWGAKARLTASVVQPSPLTTTGASMPSQSNQSRRPDKVLPSTGIEVETFTLGLGGFEPKQLSRRPGIFILGIDNRSRFVDATFELVREDGSRVHEIKGAKGQTRLRKVINLPPGNYLLREVNHSTWTSEITIGR